MYQFIKDKKNIIILLIIPILSLTNSIEQAVYGYDGFHWGLVLFSADGMSKDLLPYKDLFIHYGILSTKINSIILEIFKKNFISIFFISSFAYSVSIFIQSIILKRLTNIYVAIIGSLIIFTLHPYAIYPWHTYYLFFLINIFLILRFSKNEILNYISYFILSLAILFSESFLPASLLILTFDILIVPLFFKIKTKNDIQNFIIKLVIYIIPIVIFLFYLFVKDIFDYWRIYNQMGTIFLEIINMNLLEIIISFLYNLKIYSINKFYTEPNWAIYTIIIITNILFLVKFFIKNFKEKISNEQYSLLVISFCSLVLLYQALHSFTIFKFSCSITLGLIIIFKLIYELKNFENRLVLLSILLLYSISAFPFSKNNSNHLYVDKFKKNEYVKNNHFQYFKNQKWNKKTWEHLISLEKKIIKVSTKCKIKNGLNFSSDGIISTIMRDKLEFNQLLPWYENNEGSWQKNYYNTMWKYFDLEYFNTIENKIKKNDIIIYTSVKNYPIIKIYKKEINIRNSMKKIELPYSYEHKNKILIIPNKCKDLFF